MAENDSRLSVYIHIPFCTVQCGYCAFNTYVNLERLIPEYVDALCHELAHTARSAQDQRVHTLYLGGGTPSLLNPAQVERIICQAGAALHMDDDAEISLEANPDDLSEAYLRDLRRIGVNRVSIGMQSASAAILRLFDRQHDIAAVEAGVRCARRAGFDNINLDVIFGSPGETLAEWKETVQVALRLSPDHFSLYGLELKGGTRLRQRVDAGELPSPDDDVFADMYEVASEALAIAGYDQYEISNWCKPGKECRHNLQYWRNLDYIGVGAGAHGFYKGCRHSTIASPERYVAALNGGGAGHSPVSMSPATAKSTPVTEADDLYETIMMGLRLTRAGIDRASFRRRFGGDLVERFPDAAQKLEAAGLLQVTPERVRLSKSGRLLSNLVIREFVDKIKDQA